MASSREPERQIIDTRHTPQCLFSAVYTKKLDLDRVKELLSKGEIIFERYVFDNNNTVLHRAVLNVNLQILTLLLRAATPDIVRIPNNSSDTALSLAVREGHVDMCQKLIEANADVNHIIHCGNWGSLLHLAFRQGHINVAELLLEHSADLHKLDKDGNTPLHVAVTIGFQYEEFAKYVIDKCALGDLLDQQNKDGDTPVHIAARRADFKIVELLMKHDIKTSTKNNKGDTALHIAAHKGCDKTAKMLIDKEIWVLLPLYEAVSAGNVNIVQLMLQAYEKNECLKCLDNKWGWPSVMEKAIERGEEKILALLINHCQWERFLLVEHYNDEKQRCTPMSNLIQKMPHMAPLVMDKCWKKDDPKSITADYRLVDDMIFSRKPNQNNEQRRELRNNHPLQMIERTNATQLMDHPLIKALLRREWKIASFFYFLFLFYYVVYLALITTLMFKSKPPFGNQPCENTSTSGSSEQPLANNPLRIAVYVFAVFGVVLEIIQLVLVKFKRYIEFHNIFDWFTYFCPFIVFGTSSSCGELMHWQWQLGIACLFVAYINMLFYLRIVPMLGIYIMMVTLMLRNFLRFFLIMFLFLLSFGICFYLLLQNQVGFSNLGFSVMKSYTMMLGDVDFAGIFLDQLESDDEDVALHYVAMLWVLYIAFLVLMALVMMNLLTSLAVNGVETLEEDSQYKIMALQITLALDVEFALPTILHEKLECVVKTEKFPLELQNNWCVACLILCKEFLFYGSLCKRDILEQAVSFVENGRSAADTRPLRRGTEKPMDKLTKRVDNLDKKLDDITDLLTKILLGGKLTDAPQKPST